jgi:hypothetical protein
MAIIQITSSSKGKCISCYFYKYKNYYWLSGNCVNFQNKIKRRQREWNDKICKTGFRRGEQ